MQMVTFIFYILNKDKYLVSKLVTYFSLCKVNKNQLCNSDPNEVQIIYSRNVQQCG